MPDFWTHIIAGQEMIEKSDDKELSKLIDKNQKIFNFGCQGPDFFFYSDFWPWIREKKGTELGDRLHHEKTGELILESVCYLKKIKEESLDREYKKLLTYFFGFISHYVLDFSTHPFIFQKAGEGNPHKRMEMELDIIVMREKWGQDPVSISPLKAFDLGDDLPVFIQNYYLFIIKKLFSLKKEGSYINNSYQDFKKYHRIFYSPHKIKSTVIKLVDSLFSRDIALYSYAENKRFKLFVEAELDYESFYREYDKGIKEGIRLIQIILRHLDGVITKKELAGKIPDRDFTGG